MEVTFYASVKHPFAVSRVKRYVEYIFVSQKKPDAAVSIHLIGDKKMTTLNSQYRGKNKPTDVLSFALQEGESVGAQNEWGDVFICVAQVKRQAKEYGISWKEEFYRMLTHGILHLLGYDHERPREAKVMFSLQERLLEKALWK